MTTRIVLIARNAFRTIMSRRALYVWAAAALLMFLRAAPQIIAGFRSERMRLFQHSNAVAGSLEVWALLALGAAILLAAGSVATEMTTKTIVTVMARPVHRWELLVGKWLGVSAFAFVTLCIGVMLALGLARYLGVDVDLVILRFAVERSVVAIVVYAGIAVVLGSFGSWVIAAGLTLMLAFMPILITELKNIEDSPNWRRVGVTLDWVVPDGYEGRYSSISRVPFPELPAQAGAPARPRVRVTLTTRDHYADLLESLVYGAVYFLAGCAAFSRRNIKLA